ncbi:hypothetical protein VSS86_23420, partial [Bacillus safensis]|uniref:hypothetical protein n=1 Tax=Bacillus safensis TaxID=561879 RepID=UPI002DD44190
TRSRQTEQLVRQAIGTNVLGVKRLKIRFVPREVAHVDFAEEFIAPEISAHSPEKDDHSHEHHDHSQEDFSRKNR